MRAVVIERPGDADVLSVREVPEPRCGPTDLLVDVAATALNRADLLQRRGLYPAPGPACEFEVPGLEFAGEIAQVGERVDDFAVGDRVMGILSAGGYAERVVVNHRLASRVPEGLELTEAAAVPEAFITAHDALRQCELQAGESVLIHAVGSGVGVAAIQVAEVIGAAPIMGTAGSDEKLAAAAKLGLDVGIGYKTQDFAEEALRVTGGHGADVILDFVGASYLERNLRALATCGRMIVIGMLGGIKAELNLAVLLAKRARIIGTVLRSRSLEEKAMATRTFERTVLPYLESGRVRPIVDRVFPLEQAADAHRYMETNANFGKIVLTI